MLNLPCDKYDSDCASVQVCHPCTTIYYVLGTFTNWKGPNRVPNITWLNVCIILPIICYCTWICFAWINVVKHCMDTKAVQLLFTNFYKEFRVYMKCAITKLSLQEFSMDSTFNAIDGHSQEVHHMCGVCWLVCIVYISECFSTL